MSRRARSAVFVEPLEERCLLAGIATHVNKVPSRANFPGNLTVGADHNIWYTSGLSNYIGVLSPTTGVDALLATSGVMGSHNQQGMALGGNGSIYFHDFWDNDMGVVGRRNTLAKLRVTLNGAQNLLAGPDRNFWYTEFDNKISRLVPSTGVITTFDNGSSLRFSDPISGESIASFAGMIWCVANNGINEVTTAGVSAGSVATAGSVQAISVVGRNLWFTENISSGSYNGVGYVNSRGATTVLHVAKAYGNLAGIAAGRDGGIYVLAGEYLLKLNTAGTILAAQNLGLAAGGSDMITGPDGNVWFTQGVLGQISVAYAGGSAFPAEAPADIVTAPHAVQAAFSSALPIADLFGDAASIF